MREGWKYIKLGEIIHIKHGYGFKGEYFVEEPNNNFLLTPGNFAIGGGFKSDKMKYYDGPINDEFILSVGDVIVTMTDLSKQADILGYSAKIPSDPENTYLHNQRLGLVSLKTNDFDLDYIYWLLRTQYYQKYIAGSSSGATVKHTSPKKIYSTKLLVPESKETQRKIARILSAYDDLIENNLKRIKLLEEKAQLTYEEWFVRMKFPGYETSPINKETGLPEGWERKAIKDLSKLVSGFAFKSKDFVEDGNYKLVTIKNVQEGVFINKTSDTLSIIPEKVKPEHLLKDGDIIMSLTGNVGRTCLVYGENYLLNQRVLKIQPFHFKSFIYWLLRSRKTIKELENLSNGAAQQNLSPINLGKHKVLIPSKEILRRFSAVFDVQLNVAIELNKQNQLLKEARDILLPRLMTGMIDVEQMNLETVQPTTT